MPLIRRLPKRGFNNARFHKTYAVINLSDLSDFKAGTVVNEKLLRESNLMRGNVAGVKILGNGELSHALTIEADKVSASAREKIDKAGGTITLREARARHEAAPGDAVADGAAADQKDAAPKAARKTSGKKSAAKTGARAKKTTPRKS
jgi:ribosomal protein L18E